MKKFTPTILPFLSLFFVLISCDKPKDNNQESSSEAANKIEGPVFQEDELGNPIKNHVNNVLNAYNALKSALVETDPEKAKKSGEDLVELMGNFDSGQLTGQIAESYGQVASDLRQAAEEIAQSEDIESQRTTFSALSNGVYKMVKTFPVNDETLYYTYCPMTFEDGGSYWLDREETITNPYFGSEMLNCGTVKETIE